MTDPGLFSQQTGDGNGGTRQEDYISNHRTYWDRVTLTGLINILRTTKARGRLGDNAYKRL